MIRSLAWRSVRARKGRAVLNGLGIVLGVALFFSVLSLSKTIVSTFDELFSARLWQNRPDRRRQRRHRHCR